MAFSETQLYSNDSTLILKAIAGLPNQSPPPYMASPREIPKSQYYFLAEKLSGEFGTGTGEEYGEYDPKYGTYLPLWMPLEDVLNKNVLPRELVELVLRSHQEGWKAESVIILEDKK